MILEALTFAENSAKCLTLDFVRNKDRMAVEPIVRLIGSPTVLDVLEEVTFVVHTVMLKKYRF